jgi:hypothetical protein
MRGWHALIADPKSVGWRAYKSVYPKCSRHAAETGYTRLSKNAAFAARLDELKAAAAEGAVATAREVLEELTRIGLANMADYVVKDDITLPISKLTDTRRRPSRSTRLSIASKATTTMRRP